MAEKAKFDREAAFKSIIGAGRQSENAVVAEEKNAKKNSDRVQRAYYLDRDIDNACDANSPVMEPVECRSPAATIPITSLAKRPPSSMELVKIRPPRPTECCDSLRSEETEAVRVLEAIC